jgi:integrase
MSVTLRKRLSAGGNTSFRLDIIHGGNRWYEPLKDIRLVKGTSPVDRQANKENLDLAKRIAIKRAQELASDEYSMQTDAGKKTNVLAWMQHYVDGYTLKDKRNMQGAVNRFKDFLARENVPALTMKGLTENMMLDFRDYLNTRSIGEGAASYFARFKKIVKKAYKLNLLALNPGADVEVVGRGKARKKDILTLAEIKILAGTPISSDEVRRAFLFSCFTGLRWIDIKALQWKSINVANASMDVLQSKTERNVHVNLNGAALKLLGESSNSEALVFDLPGANGANKTIKAWVKRAGIQKKITWHNARHSFGTNLIYNNIDPITTSKLMGHTSLANIYRYVDAADEMKRDAVNVLDMEI